MDSCSDPSDDESGLVDSSDWNMCLMNVARMSNTSTGDRPMRRNYSTQCLLMVNGNGLSTCVELPHDDQSDSTTSSARNSDWDGNSTAKSMSTHRRHSIATTTTPLGLKDINGSTLSLFSDAGERVSRGRGAVGMNGAAGGTGGAGKPWRGVWATMPRSRRGSSASTGSLGSCLGAEYSSMVSQWVDSDWGDLDDRLIAQSGDGFRSAALLPAAAAAAAAFAAANDPRSTSPSPPYGPASGTQVAALAPGYAAGRFFQLQRGGGGRGGGAGEAFLQAQHRHIVVHQLPGPPPPPPIAEEDGILSSRTSSAAGMLRCGSATGSSGGRLPRTRSLDNLLGKAPATAATSRRLRRSTSCGDLDGGGRHDTSFADAPSLGGDGGDDDEADDDANEDHYNGADADDDADDAGADTPPPQRRGSANSLSSVSGIVVGGDALSRGGSSDSPVSGGALSRCGSSGSLPRCGSASSLQRCGSAGSLPRCGSAGSLGSAGGGGLLPRGGSPCSGGGGGSAASSPRMPSSPLPRSPASLVSPPAAASLPVVVDSPPAAAAATTSTGGVGNPSSPLGESVSGGSLSSPTVGSALPRYLGGGGSVAGRALTRSASFGPASTGLGRPLSPGRGSTSPVRCSSDTSSPLAGSSVLLARHDGGGEFTRTESAERPVPRRIASLSGSFSASFSPGFAASFSERSRRSSRRRSSSLLSAASFPEFSRGALQLAALRPSLSSLDFCALDYSPDDLAVIAAQIFLEMEIDRLLRVHWPSVQSFVLSVRARMLDNPYHNWVHVVDVTQTAFSLAVQSGVLACMTGRQRLVLYLAALCHDLEHPGVTAAFLLKSQSSMAACYRRDPAMLERHHSLRAYELMACQHIGLLQSLGAEERGEISTLVRDVILATDMTRHGVFCAATQSAKAEGLAEAREKEKADADILLHMQLILKCADISNVLKAPRAAREWAVRITDEFFAQGDLERANGLDVTPMCDRSRQSRVGLQKGFIDAVAGPFIAGLARVLPRLEPLTHRLAANRRAWDAVADEDLLAEVPAQL